MAQRQKQQTAEIFTNNIIYMPNIQWKNLFILNAKTIKDLDMRIKAHLSIRKYGFSPLNDSIYQSFITRKLNNLFTINGTPLSNVPNIINLLRMLRSHQITFIHIRCNKKLESLLKSDGFSNLFPNCDRKFTKKDLDVWLTICNQKIIPPYKLLVEWLKKQRKFTKNKEIKDWIIQQENKGFPHSLAYFANEISKYDSRCWRFE